jgi:hypothetical protein
MKKHFEYNKKIHGKVSVDDSSSYMSCNSSWAEGLLCWTMCTTFPSLQVNVLANYLSLFELIFLLLQKKEIITPFLVTSQDFYERQVAIKVFSIVLNIILITGGRLEVRLSGRQMPGYLVCIKHILWTPATSLNAVLSDCVRRAGLDISSVSLYTFLIHIFCSNQLPCRSNSNIYL